MRRFRATEAGRHNWLLLIEKTFLKNSNFKKFGK